VKRAGRCARTAIEIACVVFLLLQGVASASPLDLSDTTPRWIEVRFEVSPEDSPGRLDDVWSEARRAYIEPAGLLGHVLIRIPGTEREAQLRSTGAKPIGGSFSEFVWTLEPMTGHVLRAELSGRLREEYALGFLRSSTEVEIRVEMTTRIAAGFRPAKRIMGQRAHRFCVGSKDARDCTIVPPIRFDRARGYVNAVGSLHAWTAIAGIRTFSPLGEVIFSEVHRNLEESSVFGRSSHVEPCPASTLDTCGLQFGGNLYELAGSAADVVDRE